MAALSIWPDYWFMDPDGSPTHPDAEVPIPAPGQERELLTTIAEHGQYAHRAAARAALRALDSPELSDPERR